jgi:threonine dehydratase
MSAAMRELNLELITEAANFLRGRIRRTPMEPSPGLSAKLGVPVTLKLESLQVTGSFKVRGALFRLSQLTEAERRAGFITCSAGNHGKGTSYAARELGVRATIFVPSTVDQAKYRSMAAMGAEVRVSEFPSYDAAEDQALEEARRSGRPFISAFDDTAVMAGNGGTLAAEILEDAPDAKEFILPVGGGGMAAGLAVLVKEKVRDARLIAVQHAQAAGFKLSMDQGRAVTRMSYSPTLAGGIEGGTGAMTFEILKTRTDRIALVDDAQISNAMRWMLDEHQYLIEPTAAAAVAACLEGAVGKLSGPAVVVISGRNVSGETIRKIVCS